MDYFINFINFISMYYFKQSKPAVINKTVIVMQFNFIIIVNKHIINFKHIVIKANIIITINNYTTKFMEQMIYFQIKNL